MHKLTPSPRLKKTGVWGKERPGKMLNETFLFLSLQHSELLWIKGINPPLT